MSPLGKEDVRAFEGGTGEFTSIRKLVNPGQKVTVKLLDIVKNHKTKYPIKDKDYSFRLTLEKDGKRLLMDMNGADTIRQVLAALYPNGSDGDIVPCFAIISRRTERKTFQGEMILERGDALSKGEDETIRF